MFEEEKTEVIGSFCTLLEDFGGVSDGMIVGDYGHEVVVQPSSGHQIVASLDEVVIFD